MSPAFPPDERNPGGYFVERPGTPFNAPHNGPRATTAQSRAIHDALYAGAINSGIATDVEALAPGYLQNTGWTPNGRDIFGLGWQAARSQMPDGKATQPFVVAEHERVASLSVWDGTVTSTGEPVDFLSADFLRIENHLAAEHWDTVDYMNLYTAFGRIPKED